MYHFGCKKIALLLGFLLICVGSAPAQSKIDEGASLFGFDRVLNVHMKMTQANWDEAQPPARQGGPMMMPPPGGNPPAGSSPNSPRPGGNAPGKFGFEFKYVHGDVEIDGKSFKDAGIRFKGNSSYASSQNSLKRPFKFDFDQYVKEGQLFGQTTLNFSNNFADSSQIREAVSYDIFRQINVPYSRTAFVKLFLTVAGKYDKQYIGLYTMVEQVDQKFLRQHFGNDSGLLVKPEGVGSLQYLGDDWAAYKEKYDPKSGHKGVEGEKAKKQMIAFVKFFNQVEGADFKKGIEAYLDVDEFLRFLAGNAALSNLDSFLSMGHNFYMYLNPATNKIVFIPWDLNMAMGGFGMAGGGDQQTNLSIMHPHSGSSKLIEKILEIESYKQKYREYLQQIVKGAMNPERLQAQISALEKVTAEAIASEPEDARNMGFRPPPMPNGDNRGGGQRIVMRGGGMGMNAPALKDFVAKRAENIELQLAGKKEGYIPQNRMMGGGGMMMNMGAMLAPELMKAMDEDANKSISKAEFEKSSQLFFSNADKDKNGKLNLEEVTAELNRIIPGPPGMGAPLPPPGAEGQPRREFVIIGGPGGGFSPGNMIGSNLFRQADSNSDTILSKEEFFAFTGKFFTEADMNKNSALDEKELNDGVSKLMPPPQMGGPQMRPPRIFQDVPGTAPKPKEND